MCSYGDEVKVTGGEHEGRIGCIVSMNLSSPLGTIRSRVVMGVTLRSKRLLSTVGPPQTVRVHAHPNEWV